MADNKRFVHAYRVKNNKSGAFLVSARCGGSVDIGYLFTMKGLRNTLRQRIGNNHLVWEDYVVLKYEFDLETDFVRLVKRMRLSEVMNEPSLRISAR